MNVAKGLQLAENFQVPGSWRNQTREDAHTPSSFLLAFTVYQLAQAHVFLSSVEFLEQFNQVQG